MRIVGLHLRIFNDLLQVASRAVALQLKSFQCFLMYQATKKPLRISHADIKEFRLMRKQFHDLYVHGTYWINLCGEYAQQGYGILKKELKLAKRLGFSHYVLHPGSANGWQDRMQGIDCLVRLLNDLTKQENEIKIILENTAHGGKSVGSDLYDFKLIREKLDVPEKIAFCIDTAHAHAFGYDIISPNGLKQFFEIIEATIGFDALALIHLNDTKEPIGFKKDRHEVIGQGLIGSDALRRFVHDERLKKVPIILELPQVEDDEQEKILKMVRAWHQ